MSYRTAPVPLPSLRDVDAEEATAPRATSIGLGFELYCYLSAREPFILGELREERRARDRAAAAPCPAFETGEPLGPARWFDIPRSEDGRRLAVALLRGWLDE